MIGVRRRSEGRRGAVGADGAGRFEQAGADQAGGRGVEVQQCVGGVAGSDAVLVAQGDDCVSQRGALLGVFDLLGDRCERVKASVGIVIFDGFAQTLQIGADQRGKRDQQQVVKAGQVDQVFPENVERVVRGVGQIADRLRQNAAR